MKTVKAETIGEKAALLDTRNADIEIKMNYLIVVNSRTCAVVRLVSGHSCRTDCITLARFT